jgi:hypothetical protein
MRLVIAAMVALPLLAGTPASAASEKAAEGKVVCKNKAKTGTRFPSKMCRTRSEWEQISAQNKRDAKEMIDKPIVANDCQGAGC